MLPILLRAASRPGLSPRVALTVDEMILDLYNDTRYHASDPHQVTDLVKRDTPYWLENIHHQGTSAFHPAGYTVFRNVKDYGAIGLWLTLVDMASRPFKANSSTPVKATVSLTIRYPQFSSKAHNR